VRTRELDVVVAGAGPAGSAAAIALTLAGRRVLLADLCGARPSALKIGETLPAVAASALADLKLLEQFKGSGVAICSTGTSAAWGDDEPLSSDAIIDPHGHGWHLDRARFDAWLREQAAAAGVELCEGRVAAQRVDTCELSGPRSQDDRAAAWHVRIGGRDGRRVVCRWVIDATGRRAAVARAQGAQRERRDRLVAVYALLRTGTCDVDARTRVAATPAGWWYSARIGEGRRVVAFLTDADLLDPALRAPADFAAAAATAGAGGGRILPVAGDTSVEVESGPATTAAHGARLRPACGDGWLAVGDAALAFDPLSSQGILNALVTALLGAAAVETGLRGEPQALASYDRRLAAVWSAYESNLSGAYALERRWQDAVFWARRAGTRD